MNKNRLTESIYLGEMIACKLKLIIEKFFFFWFIKKYAIEDTIKVFLMRIHEVGGYQFFYEGEFLKILS